MTQVSKDGDIETNGINEMTLEELQNVPMREWGEELFDIDSIIILPTQELHDSDFRIMEFIAVINELPICKIAGGSDVIHINGIGGFGYKWLQRYGSVPKCMEPLDWSIDCLKKSGLLRIFLGRPRKMIAGVALSSFELFHQPEKK